MYGCVHRKHAQQKSGAKQFYCSKLCLSARDPRDVVNDREYDDYAGDIQPQRKSFYHVSDQDTLRLASPVDGCGDVQTHQFPDLGVRHFARAQDQGLAHDLVVGVQE